MYYNTKSLCTLFLFITKYIASSNLGWYFSLANFPLNFSKKFSQKLTSNPKGSFYSIFCEKIVFELQG